MAFFMYMIQIKHKTACGNYALASKIFRYK